MANPNARHIQLLPFHPFEPSLPQKTKPIKSKQRPLREFHPYAPPIPNNANLPPPPIVTNIKGMMFHPHKPQTPIPVPSSQHCDWQVKWMEQFHECKIECDKMIKQKTDEIDRLKQLMKRHKYEHNDVVQKWRERCDRRDGKINMLKQKFSYIRERVARLKYRR